MPRPCASRRVDEAEIDAYVASGEPLLVAGAFTIEVSGVPSSGASRATRRRSSGSSLSTLRDLVRELDVAVAVALESATRALRLSEPPRRDSHC